MDIKKMKDSELDDKYNDIVDSWEFDDNKCTPFHLNDLIDVIAEMTARSNGKKEIK